MIKELMSRIKEKDNKRIFSNFLSLTFLQGANLVLPLITFPYLVKVLGVEKYGLIFFAQAFVTYFSLLADYGFNLSGTREVSIYKNDHKKLVRIYNSILQAKFYLVVAGFLAMSIIVFSVEKFSKDWDLYFLTYGMVVGNFLFPIWFFQGMERMMYITILTLISKTIFTFSIFILVKSPADYLWIPILNSIGQIFIGLIALLIIYKNFEIPFRVQEKKYQIQQLKKGWFIFFSNISVNTYTVTTTFILGLVTNNTMVGYYVIADKVIRIIQGLFAPVAQSIYPHIVYLAQVSRVAAIRYVSEVLKYVLIISIFIFAIALPFGGNFFHLVFGGDVGHSIELFRILSPLIIILPVSTIIFGVVLLSFKLDTLLLKIYAAGACVNAGMLSVLLFYFQLSTIGAAISLVTCELFIVIAALFLLYRNDIKVFSFLGKS